MKKKLRIAKSLYMIQWYMLLILLRLRTRTIVNALIAARQQSNGNSGAWMSQICGQWMDVFIRTLSPNQRLPVQDHGSKIPAKYFVRVHSQRAPCYHNVRMCECAALPPWVQLCYL